MCLGQRLGLGPVALDGTAASQGGSGSLASIGPILGSCPISAAQRSEAREPVQAFPRAWLHQSSSVLQASSFRAPLNAE